MKNIALNFALQTERFIKKNMDIILTAVATIGVGAVAISSSKAGAKSVNKIDRAENNKNGALTFSEKAKIVIPIYIPVILFTGLTAGTILLSYSQNKKQKLALASAYNMLNESYLAYKRQLGKEDRTVIKEIVQNKFHDNALRDKVLSSPNNILCYDENSGQYFESTLSKLVMAEYQFNRLLSYKESGSLNDFYECLGLPPISGGDVVGWITLSPENQYEKELFIPWVDFVHEQVSMDNDRLECIIISTPLKPVDLMEYYYSNH